jgi:hypothetical protein
VEDVVGHRHPGGRLLRPPRQVARRQYSSVRRQAVAGSMTLHYSELLVFRPSWGEDVIVARRGRYMERKI